MGKNRRMELVRHRILTGTCPECGTRLTGQELGQSTDDGSPVEWVLVKQWCYNGCLSMMGGRVIPVQPKQAGDDVGRTRNTHLIIGR